MTTFESKLTELEKDCIEAIYASEYNGGYGTDQLPCIWSFSIADNCLKMTQKQVSGVVSSLVKKGIVCCQGTHGDDQNEATVGIISQEAHDYATAQGWNG